MTEEYLAKDKCDPVDQHVGKRLKMRRLMLGLSQQDLGSAVNVSIQQIQKYEKALNRISCGRIFAFSKFLSVPVDYFFKEAKLPDESLAVCDEREGFDLSAVPEKEVLHLIKSFTDIKDVNVRKKVVDLVRALSGSGKEII